MCVCTVYAYISICTTDFMFIRSNTEKKHGNNSVVMKKKETNTTRESNSKTMESSYEQHTFPTFPTCVVHRIYLLVRSNRITTQFMGLEVCECLLLVARCCCFLLLVASLLLLLWLSLNLQVTQHIQLSSHAYYISYN